MSVETYSFLVALHSGVRWLIVLAFVITLLKFALGFFQKGSFTDLDSRLLSVYSLLLVVQFLIGLLVIGIGMSLGLITGIHWMHMLIMILAIGVAASTAGRVRRAIGGDTAKFQTGLAGTLLSSLLIVMGITAVGGW